MYSTTELQKISIARLKQVCSGLGIAGYSKITRKTRREFEQQVFKAQAVMQSRRRVAAACAASQYQRTGSGFAAFSADAALTQKQATIAGEILESLGETELQDFRAELVRRRRAQDTDRVIREVQRPEPSLVDLFSFFVVALLAMVQGAIALGCVAFTLGKAARRWVAAEDTPAEIDPALIPIAA